MKSLLFATALFCSGIDALKTNTLLQQNFDSIFGTADNAAVSSKDQLENVDSASSAYVVDQLGNLYVTPDYVDDFNLAYAAPTLAPASPQNANPAVKTVTLQPVQQAQP